MLWKSGEIKKKDNFTWMIKQIQHVPNYTLIFSCIYSPLSQNKLQSTKYIAGTGVPQISP